MGHNQFNILGFESAVIDFLIVVVIFFDLLVFDCLALAVVMVMVVVVTRMISISGLGSSKLLSSGGLRLGVEIFDLGFAEDAVVLVSLCARSACSCSTHIQVLLVGDR